jgi:hypothetical protein
MRFLRSSLTISAALFLSMTSAAQSRPDFSGRWVAVSPQAGAGEGLDVKQDANTLTVLRDEVSITFKFDGSETRTALPVHETDEVVILSNAAWQDNTLVMTMAATYPAGNKVARREVWSLDADGRLSVDFTDRVGTPAEKNTKLSYKRQ